MLASLAERGFVTRVSREPSLRYRARPPEQVLGSLLAVRRSELDQLAERSTNLATQLQARFLDGQDRGEPLDYVEVLRDPAHTVQRIEHLWNGAEDKILAIVRPPYLAPPSADDATLPSGVQIRVIYERSLLEDPNLDRLLDSYARLGEEIRIGDDLPLKLTVIDGRVVAFNMPDPVENGASVTTIVVHHRDLAATLEVAFETLWSKSDPFRPLPEGVSTRDRKAKTKD